MGRSCGQIEQLPGGKFLCLAIGGKGFFKVKSSESQNIYYTRAGVFRFDSDGNLTDPNGNIVQGREWDSTPSLANPAGAPSGVDTDIIISQAPSQPRATEKIDMNVNLRSNSVWAGTIAPITGTGPVSGVGASSGLYPASGTYTTSYVAAVPPTVPPTGTLTVTVGANTYSGTIAAGQTYEDFGGGSGLSITTVGSLTFPNTGGAQGVVITGFDVTNPATTSNYSSSVTVYDSLGQAHTANMYFRKASEDPISGQSTWEWIAELDAADSSTGVNAIQGTGTVVFSNTGVLVSGGEAQPISFNFSQGASPAQPIDLVLGPATGGGTTTQYPISSTTSYQTQDGYPPGVLQSVSVSSEGIISGTYSNGQIIRLYQLTLANFNNPNGLYKEGSNLYSETLASGVAYTNSPGEGGLGKVSPNSLEQSNVDLASEFVKMIIAQRGFQANSKVITTTDEILQELMNLKR